MSLRSGESKLGQQTQARVLEKNQGVESKKKKKDIVISEGQGVGVRGTREIGSVLE